jgi:hypothetical protein
MDIHLIQPEEIAEAIQLADLVFRRKETGKRSFEQTHPLLF